MKKIVPVLAVSLIATVGASSASQAAVIDFGVSAIGGTPGVSYMGATLDQSTAFDFDGAVLAVTSVASNDDSGLKIFPTIPSTVMLTPTTEIMYGSGSGHMDIGIPGGDVEKVWTADGDTFTETLTTVTDIDRSTPNAITVTLLGTLTDSLLVFDKTPVNFILSANQSGGVGPPPGAIQAGFTDVSVTGSVPEPSTWVMMALGFIGLGYAAVRRSSKDRSALAI